ncbi:FAD synthetase [Siminovitchia sediminis]|uniref:FAD synthase n=1 Tax=Siminovitchia sediminis TaxID=1274353 RepID=A0ABW4KPU7_9BACI
MQVHQPNTLTLPASVIAIGAFDGIHLGHQRLIERVVNRSKEMGVPSLVYTFDPPPRVYFQGARMLTSIEEKLERLATLQVDHVVVAPFDFSYTQQRAIEYIKELSSLNPSEIIVGGDFRFGYKREGGLDDLRRYFQVKVFPSVCCSQGRVVSSSRIRELISHNAYTEAQSLLNWNTLDES